MLNDAKIQLALHISNINKGLNLLCSMCANELIGKKKHKYSKRGNKKVGAKM